MNTFSHMLGNDRCYRKIEKYSVMREISHVGHNNRDGELAHCRVVRVGSLKVRFGQALDERVGQVVIQIKSIPTEGTAAWYICRAAGVLVLEQSE